MKIPNLLWAGVLFLSLAVPLPLAVARTFTAADGRTLEGEIVDAGDVQVTIRRTPDDKILNLAIANLSNQDQEEIVKWRASRASNKIILSATKNKVPTGAKTKNKQETANLKVNAKSEMWCWTITLKNATKHPVEGLELRYSQLVECKDRNQGAARGTAKKESRRGGGTLKVPPIAPFGSVTVQTDGIVVQALQATSASTSRTSGGERVTTVSTTKWDESLSGLGVSLFRGPDCITKWKMGTDPGPDPLLDGKANPPAAPGAKPGTP
ncbi:MAG: hypothetical protein JWM59_2510 [Verrucomicrobiales bacterium]|nr:hypothetical protein [Verrucomicrobiales bacterium]